jgi:Flp pilus assembly protein TadD
MKIWTVLPFFVLLAGCATAPVAPRPERLFDDHLFVAASERISKDDVFAVSDEMKRYLSVDIADQLRAKGNQQGLFDALYSKGQLKLEYDSVMTRNAAQAFAARSGNCLSLVIMTAALAKELGLTVSYQSANVGETWGRTGDVQFFIGHVNLTLGKPQTNFGLRRNEDDLTIDFLAPYEIRGMRTREIREATIVAMYMNNRAAELVAQGRLDDAYWWAHAAIEADPGFLSSYNTLGVIYRRHGNPAEAERVLAYALESEPRNTHVMANLVQVLHDLGRDAESKALGSKLAQIEPNPAFSYFSQGMVAVRSGDFKTAKDMFAKEVDRAPYYHEFHFWLAVAYVGLGDVEQARKQLTIAMETSTTQHDHAVYAAKLDRIKASKEPAVHPE